MYANGKGVPKDDSKAAEWNSIATVRIAAQRVEDQKYEDALTTLKQIDVIRPFYRDVKKQEEAIAALYKKII